MKLATAPVNWNNADVTDYRPWVPYPALLDQVVAAGYDATEWGMNMERDAAKLLANLQQRNLQILGGFVGLELGNREKRDQEIARGLEIGQFFQPVGAPYLIAADSGDDRRRAEAGHVDPNGALTKEQWSSLATGLNDLAGELAPIRPIHGDALRGFFPVEELKTFDKGNSRLQGHPDVTKLPGLETSTGSLGMGLSVEPMACLCLWPFSLAACGIGLSYLVPR